MSFTPNGLSQRDPQWIDEKLGFDDTVTIGTDGAALVCLTMLVNGYGFHETPSSLNRKLKELGSGIGFLGSLIVWPGLTRAFPKINFCRIVVCRDQPAPMEDINTSLDSGQPLMIEINRSPAPDLQNHWILLYARQGNDYLMLDPWSLPPDNGLTTLINRYGYGDAPSEFITAVGWYEVFDSPSTAHVPAEAAAPPETRVPTPTPAVAVPPKSLTVLVSQSIGSAGLRLRSLPATNANILAILPAGTKLTTLEPTEQALLKIGQRNQWLSVRDGDGNVGYVAAGYVEPENAPVPAPASLTVLVSSQASAGLHLRDRPSEYGNILEVLKAGTLLTVLEPVITAQAKIGVVNQWLHVKLPGGMTGYVAAWFVTT